MALQVRSATVPALPESSPSGRVKDAASSVADLDTFLDPTLDSGISQLDGYSSQSSLYLTLDEQHPDSL